MLVKNRVARLMRLVCTVGMFALVVLVGSGLAIRRLIYCAMPRILQRKTLQRILAANATTPYGHSYDLASIDGYEAYSHHVSQNTYEDLRPWIERSITQGVNLLANCEIYKIGTTSGTTGQPKSILQSRSLYRYEYFEYTVAILFRILLTTPLALLRPLGIIASSSESVRHGTLQGNNAANTLYRGSPFRSLAALPPMLFELSNRRARYYYFALFLTAARCRCLITPNPTTILEILDAGTRHAEWFKADFSNAPSNWFDIPSLEWNALMDAWANIEGKRSTGTLLADVRLIVTWTRGSCGYFARRFSDRLKNVKVRELGYLATDSPICVPVGGDDAQVLAIDSVFAEFTPLDGVDRRPRLYHELEDGLRYEICVTNRYGLYRYMMHDIVEVRGRILGSPIFHFVRKSSGFCNITGEKLSEDQLCVAMSRIESLLDVKVEFFVALPEIEFQGYEVFCDLVGDTVPSKSFVGEVLDEVLCELNVEYRSKRRDGRLRPPRIILVAHGAAERYKHALLCNGRRDVQFKMRHLLADDSGRPLLLSLCG